MPSVSELRTILDSRREQVPAELRRGESLREILEKHLRAAEDVCDPGLITSVLLLSEDGKRLFHGAAPRLPRSYCDLIDGSEIGPSAGSCGTAAFRGERVYVGDISRDPLWANYRHIALPHGLKSCWSTPITDSAGQVLGTFAIYRRVEGNPGRTEIAAIEMITEQVAHAILLALDIQDLEPAKASARGRLRLVASSGERSARSSRYERLLSIASTLQIKASELDQLTPAEASPDTARALKEMAHLSRQLVAAIRLKADKLRRLD